MNISAVSEKYDISPDTLRYYERIGLIPPVKRNKSGIRDYGEIDLMWIQYIKCMRSAGMTIFRRVLQFLRQNQYLVGARMCCILSESVHRAEKQTTLPA